MKGIVADIRRGEYANKKGKKPGRARVGFPGRLAVRVLSTHVCLIFGFMLAFSASSYISAVNA